MGRKINQAETVWGLPCPYCSGNHQREHCPRVKGFEYYPDGKIRRVSFWEPQGEVYCPCPTCGQLAPMGKCVR